MHMHEDSTNFGHIHRPKPATQANFVVVVRDGFQVGAHSALALSSTVGTRLGYW